ncbi:MAG: redoxin domain-containing protein [Myxococcaceae bacterium]
MTLLLSLLLHALPATSLPATGGGSISLAAEVAAHELTVVLFFSAECPVQRSHDARFLELVKAYEGRGVHFIAVDAQSNASIEKATEQAARRQYPFPLVVDVEGTWADALGARFTTTVAVIDRQGVTRYLGGIDSDRVTLTETATPFLRDALEAVLGGREVPNAQTKALGCVLRRR